MRAPRLAVAAAVLAAVAAPLAASAGPLPCQVHPPVVHPGPGVYVTVEKPWVDCD